MTLSRKARSFTESVIREMTRHAVAHGAVNLAQGFPDFPCPRELKDAACRAIQDDINQYAITWGARSFREALAEKTRRFLGIEVDPEAEITVTCGSTEAMIAALLAVVDPGDEVVVFEPFYENYGPDAILCGATPRYVALRPVEEGGARRWAFDPDDLARAFSPRTRAVVLNTPQNPTGKVFTAEELGAVAALCREHGAVLVTDEIYEHIVFDGRRHVAPMTLPGMRERTIAISGLSKTYSVTGWRIGYAIACPELTAGIRKVHDFLTVGAAAPLQEAGAVALGLPEAYYRDLADLYQAKRDRFVPRLEALGFRCFPPEGAYYVMADVSGFGAKDDTAFALELVRHAGVAVVPGSSFFSDPALGRNLVRFCFCKRDETLDEALDRLERWARAGAG
ncbi:MAG: aminotransferase class I/II-fold pyridoxal phosphate-dependent enzyme [Candidatus Dadabacteria bacterium]|nr:MAG: aminotransferase class I/II-fold pyridoxal phosphate-dependent enzyme [Candidatus Dadabacteria bacterium]